MCKIGDIVDRKSKGREVLRCPRCEGNLEEVYQGNLPFRIGNDIFEEEISEYTCSSCGNVYKGLYLLDCEENLDLVTDKN